MGSRFVAVFANTVTACYAHVETGEKSRAIGEKGKSQLLYI